MIDVIKEAEMLVDLAVVTHTYNLTSAQIGLLVLLAIWELAWKGLALWRASHHNQMGWFIALLVLNTAGILPIIYLLITEKRDYKSTSS